MGVIAEPDKLRKIADGINIVSATNSSSNIDLQIVKNTILTGSQYGNTPWDAEQAAAKYLGDSYTSIFIESVLSAVPPFDELGLMGVYGACLYMDSSIALEAQQVSWTAVRARFCDYATSNRTAHDSKKPFKGDWPSLITARSQLLADLWVQNIATAFAPVSADFCNFFYQSGSYNQHAMDVGFYPAPIHKTLCNDYTPKPAPIRGDADAAVKKSLTAYFKEQTIGITDDPLWLSFFCQGTYVDGLNKLGYDGEKYHSDLCAAHMRVFGKS